MSLGHLAFSFTPDRLRLMPVGCTAGVVFVGLSVVSPAVVSKMAVGVVLAGLSVVSPAVSKIAAGAASAGLSVVSPAVVSKRRERKKNHLHILLLLAAKCQLTNSTHSTIECIWSMIINETHRHDFLVCTWC